MVQYILLKRRFTKFGAELSIMQHNAGKCFGEMSGYPIIIIFKQKKKFFLLWLLRFCCTVWCTIVKVSIIVTVFFNNKIIFWINFTFASLFETTAENFFIPILVTIASILLAKIHHNYIRNRFLYRVVLVQVNPNRPIYYIRKLSLVPS
jgi:hypothetical protein